MRLLIINGSFFVISNIFVPVYEIGIPKDEIIVDNSNSTYWPLSYSIFSENIYTIQNTSIVSYSSNLDKIWTMNLADSINLLPFELTQAEILTVDADGIYIYYAEAVGTIINLKIGLFDQNGEKQTWTLHALESADFISPNLTLNIISSTIRIDTSTDIKLVAMNLNSVGYWVPNSIGFSRQVCYGDIFKLNTNSSVTLLDSDPNGCEMNNYRNIYVHNNSIYIEGNWDPNTQSALAMKRYDLETDEFSQDTTLQDNVNEISSQWNNTQYLGYFLVDNRIFTMWTNNVQHSGPVNNNPRFFYVYTDTDLIAKLDVRDYLASQFKFNSSYNYEDIEIEYLSARAEQYGIYGYSLQMNVFTLSSNIIHIPIHFSNRIPNTFESFQSLFKFEPYRNRLSIDHTFNYHENRINTTNFLKFDVLTPALVITNDITQFADKQRVRIQTWSIDPANCVGWVDQLPTFFKYIVPSVIFVIIMWLKSYIDNRKKKETGDLYPHSDLKY